MRNPERLDPELVASLIDGTLERDERDRVLAQLAADPESYEAFVEAAAVVGAEAKPAVSASAKPRRAPRGFWVSAAGLLAAGVMLAVWAATRSDAVLSPVRSAQLVAGVLATGSDPLTVRLSADWTEPGWSVVRGESDRLAEPQRSFRAGVRAVDISLASGAGDTEAVTRLADELVRLLSPVPASGPVTAEIAELARPERPRSNADLAARFDRMRRFLGTSPWLDLGASVEGARLIAGRGASRRAYDQLARSVAALAKEFHRLGENDPSRGISVILERLSMLLRMERPDDVAIRQVASQLITLAGG